MDHPTVWSTSYHCCLLCIFCSFTVRWSNPSVSLTAFVGWKVDNFFNELIHIGSYEDLKPPSFPSPTPSGPKEEPLSPSTGVQPPNKNQLKKQRHRHKINPAWKRILYLLFQKEKSAPLRFQMAHECCFGGERSSVCRILAYLLAVKILSNSWAIWYQFSPSRHSHHCDIPLSCLIFQCVPATLNQKRKTMVFFYITPIYLKDEVSIFLFCFQI